MRSSDGIERIGRIFDLIDAAVDRGATFPELMALLKRYERLEREVEALEYELASPFGRRADAKGRGA